MAERWLLTKRFVFEASHSLPNHAGACGRLHGHSWILEIEIVGASLNEKGPSVGMVVDFADMKRVVYNKVIDVLDHSHLNDVPGLSNPTSENVAKWISVRLSGHFDVNAVVVHETANNNCRYECTK